MLDRELYQKILGLEHPWAVMDVKLNLESGTVEITIDYLDGTGCCPACGKECSFHDRAPERIWRHLDTCQMQTVIKARIPRTKCDDDGVLTMKVPWAEPHGRFTLLFEAVFIGWLEACRNQSAVAARMGISGDEAHGIMNRAVERGLAKRSQLPVKAVGLDEKSMKRGHVYMTVLSDLERGVVIDVEEERTRKSAEKLLNTLPVEFRPGIECVCMDMWKNYRKAAETVLPGSDVVHDRFHVSQYLNQAVDKTRRSEQRKLSKGSRKALWGSRFLFLGNFPNLSEKQVERFLFAYVEAARTAEAWECKELFRRFWDLNSPKEARSYLAWWYKHAKSKKNEHLTKVAKMLIRHSAGILAYIKHRMTNAMAENLNGRIQQLKSIARGFRSFKHCRTNILFHYAGLELSPLKIR